MQTIVKLIQRGVVGQGVHDLATRRGVGEVGAGAGLVGGAESRGHTWHYAGRTDVARRSPSLAQARMMVRGSRSRYRGYRARAVEDSASVLLGPPHDPTHSRPGVRPARVSRERALDPLTKTAFAATREESVRRHAAREPTLSRRTQQPIVMGNDDAADFTLPVTACRFNALLRSDSGLARNVTRRCWCQPPRDGAIASGAGFRAHGSGHHVTPGSRRAGHQARGAH